MCCCDSRPPLPDARLPVRVSRSCTMHCGLLSATTFPPLTTLIRRSLRVRVRRRKHESGRMVSPLPFEMSSLTKTRRVIQRCYHLLPQAVLSSAPTAAYEDETNNLTSEVEAVELPHPLRPMPIRLHTPAESMHGETETGVWAVVGIERELVGVGRRRWSLVGCRTFQPSNTTPLILPLGPNTRSPNMQYGLHFDFRVSIPRPHIFVSSAIRRGKKIGRKIVSWLYPRGLALSAFFSIA